MGLVLLGLGLVLAFEGLVLALLPNRLEEIVRVIEEMPQETRRTIGLVAMAAGIGLIWMSGMA